MNGVVTLTSDSKVTTIVMKGIQLNKHFVCVVCVRARAGLRWGSTLW